MRSQQRWLECAGQQDQCQHGHAQRRRRDDGCPTRRSLDRPRVQYKQILLDHRSGHSLGAIPTTAKRQSNGDFVVGVKYHDFDFGFDLQKNVPFFNTNAANNELQLTLTGFLPSSFTAALGFMNVSVTDNTPGEDPADADLSLTVSADVSGGIGASDPPITISNPSLTGFMHLNTQVEVQTPAPGVPKLQANLVLNWDMAGVDANSPLGGNWGNTVFQLNHLQVDLGSILSSLAQPIAQDIKAIIDPLQPVFDVLQDRIPGLSDLSELLGGPEITLISLDKTLSALPIPPTPVLNALDSVIKLANYADTIDQLASLGSGAWIDVGSFNIAGPSGSSLLTTANAILGDVGLGNWSSLLASGGGIISMASSSKSSACWTAPWEARSIRSGTSSPVRTTAVGCSSPTRSSPTREAWRSVCCSGRTRTWSPFRTT